MEEITVNGKKETVAPGTTLGAYLDSKGVDRSVTVVEVNRVVVKREDYGALLLRARDAVEVLRFVGGG